MTFTPAADGNTGVVVISVSTVKAGYICAMEIDCEEASAPITSISFDKSEATVDVGGTVTITPTISPAGYTETPVWASDDTSIATVSNGVVTGVAAGTALITLTSPTDASIYDVCEVTVNAPTTVATPTMSVAEGTYNVAQSVTLSCVTGGATIRYTTDGTDPTSSSTVYNSAISVGQTMTIKAKAFKDGLTDSDIASAIYTLKCVAPAFSPAEGEVVYGVEVEISCDTEGATIHYTTDDSTPTFSSPTYSGAISITEDMVIKAIAIKANWDNSEVADATYLLKEPDAPTFSPAAGAVAEGSTVTISSEEGTTIYYTTNGDDPTPSSTEYSTGITINENQTIKAIAVDGGGNSSDVASATYTIVGIDLRGMYTGYVKFTPGSYTSLTNSYANYSDVTYTGSNSVDYAGWSLNAVLKTGSDPIMLQMQKTNGLVTLPPILTDAGFTIEVTAATNSVTVSDGTNSGTNSLSVSSTNANITISSPSAYAVISYITITPNDGRPEAGLEYETDTYSPYLGSSFSTPTLTNPNGLSVTYSSDDEDIATVNSSTGEVTLVAIGSTTIRASFDGNASYKAGEASYTLNVLDPDITEAPTFSIDEGAVPYGTAIALSSLTDGAAIYYTTNGDTPTSSSTLYTSTIAITDETTIKAIAIKSAKSSTVSTATYTIANPIAPTFSVATGAVISGTEVTLTAPTSCVISYTTDGGDPEDLDNITDGNTVTLTVTSAQTIKAISIDPLMNASTLASAAYTIAASIDYRSASKVIVYDDFSGLPTAYANAWSGQLTDNLSNTTSGWERTDLIKSSSLLQMKSGSGVLTSPYIQTLAGFKVKVTYGSAAALTLSIGGSSKTGGTGGGSGSQPCTVEITTTNTAIPFTLTAGSGTTYVKSIEITPLNVVTIGSAGYTTFTPTFNAEFPDGVTGYIATEIDENKLMLTSKTSVPSGTPIIIKAAAGTYMLDKIDTTPESVDGNLLQASDGTVTGNGSTIYALAKKNDVVGFYLVNDGVTVPAGKAYLIVNANVKGFTFVFEDDEDAINEVNGSGVKANGSVYDLQGRRVLNPGKGLYIVNGKKILL